jgi:predicted Zn-dependent protease with MMP-like domain
VIEVDPDRFEEMVVTALDGLPPELGRLMRNVAVTVEHRPGPPGLLGLYQGVPLTSRTSQYSGVLPDRITIYRVAICSICRTEQEVAAQVRRTVIHEVAHHFGIDDSRLRELGWLRGLRPGPPLVPVDPDMSGGPGPAEGLADARAPLLAVGTSTCRPGK